MRLPYIGSSSVDSVDDSVFNIERKANTDAAKMLPAVVKGNLVRIKILRRDPPDIGALKDRREPPAERCQVGQTVRRPSPCAMQTIVNETIDTMKSKETEVASNADDLDR